MFEVGERVYVSSPSYVREHEELCSEGIVEAIDSDGYGYWLEGFSGCWLHEYVFATKEGAQSAGRVFAEQQAVELEIELEREVAVFRRLAKS